MRLHAIFACIIFLEVLGHIPLATARYNDYSFTRFGQDASRQRRDSTASGRGTRGPPFRVYDPRPVIPPGSVILDIFKKETYNPSNNRNVTITVEKGDPPSHDFLVYIHEIKGQRINIYRRLENSLLLPADIKNVQKVGVYFWRLEPAKPILLAMKENYGSTYLTINRVRDGEDYWTRDSAVFRHTSVDDEILERLDYRVCLYFKAAPVDITKTETYQTCAGKVTVTKTSVGDGRYFKLTHTLPNGVKISRVSYNGGPTNILLPEGVMRVSAYFPKSGLNKHVSKPLLVKAHSTGSNSWYDSVTNDNKLWKSRAAPENQTVLEEVLDNGYYQHYGFVTFDISLEPQNVIPTAKYDLSTKDKFTYKRVSTPDDNVFYGMELAFKPSSGFKVDAYRNRQYVRDSKNVLIKKPSSLQTGLPTGQYIKKITTYSCSGEALGAYIEFSNRKDTGWYRKIKNSNAWTKVAFDLDIPGKALVCRLRIMMWQAGCGSPCSFVDISKTSPYKSGDINVGLTSETGPDIFNKYVHVMEKRGPKGDGITYGSEFLTLKNTKTLLPLVNDEKIQVTVYFWRHNLNKPLLMEIVKGNDPSKTIWYENAGGNSNTVWEKTNSKDKSVLVYALDMLNCKLNNAHVLDAASTESYSYTCKKMDVKAEKDPQNPVTGYTRYTHTFGTSPFTVSKVVIKHITQEGMGDFPILGVVKVCVFYPGASADHVLIYIETKTGESFNGQWYRKDTSVQRTEL